MIFATFEFKGPRMYVAPVIFALAPVINTIVTLFWHPTPAAPGTFGPPEPAPHWSLYVGIILAGLGAGLVLFAKELGEAKHAAHANRRPEPPDARRSPRRRSSRDPRGGRRAAQHGAGPRLDGADVPQARRRDSGRRGAARRAAHRLRLRAAPSSRPGSGGDFKEYLHRIKGKLPKLRRVAELFAAEHRRVSDHTNFQMAAASLTGCVRQIEEILAAVQAEQRPG